MLVTAQSSHGDRTMTIRCLLGILLTLLSAAPASAQTYPNVASQTVIGRLGTPGTTGPSSAIPFSVLRAYVGSGVSIGGSIGPNFLLDPTLGMSGATLRVVTGTSGATIPLNSGSNFFSGNNTFSNSVLFSGSVTFPNQAAYSWLLNNTASSGPPTQVTIGTLTLNGAPDPSNTTLPCETGGVLGKCTAGSLAGSLTSGITSIGGSSGPSISLDSNSLAMTGTTLSVKTGASGHTIPYLDGTNIFSGVNTFSGVTYFSGAAGFGTASPTTGFKIDSQGPVQIGGAAISTVLANNLAISYETSRHRLYSTGPDSGTAGQIDLTVGSTIGSLQQTLRVKPSGLLQATAYTTAGCLANDTSGNISTATCGGNSPNLLNVRDYGTVGAGSDQTAFQNAVNALAVGKTVYVPCGNYTFTATVTFGNNGFRIIGDDVGCVRITASGDFPIFTVSSNADISGNVFRDITCIYTIDGSSTACLWLAGTSGVIGYSQISRVRCFGANTCLRNARNVNVGGEARFDWNSFTDIQTSNNGAVPTRYAIFFDNGSGTGNVYSNMNLVNANGGILFGGTNGSNIGDITISNIQFGGAGTAMSFGASGAYRSRVTMSNVQCDAGVVTCVAAANYNRLSLTSVILGGGVANSISGSTEFYCGSFAC
ncbi:hypothetical protein FXV83_20730 [Bradyrhizobium hipponense]|uniref:Pectate lyase superfamily protein domain-containing protein n=1 Tax=Bradyrhizobium hipponense TaxID=2605638 RepID=A0A5S4YJR1_9BRAD|nr:hypothetical protein [Bradyrhizobium hipponense]TYO64626.1 hypothetical protein FXV83_20730 [Bradyrhizobium hipponense]